ncbi:MAG: c-type cytochrome biogenesis protein CcmI [Candidatus Endonucleobacter sp. (ex Gigantidas childressi)]|nr:c-type cytochrome biogenesis protein CcmI [Candidatus Endonucleobacter sp. (ex Gigantidas childressi)]
MIFWGVVFFLIAFSVLLTILPLVSKYNKKYAYGQYADQQYKRANMASFKEQQADISLRVESKIISQLDADKLTLELEKKLLSELSHVETSRAKTLSQPNIKLTVCLAIAIPFITLILYNKLGSHTELVITDILKSQDATIEQVVALIEDWKEQQPENTQALYLLASQYLTLGRLDDAVQEYRKLYVKSDRHPQISSHFAQALFLLEKQVITDEVRILYQESLQMDPDNTTALGLKGIDAFEQTLYNDAANAWQMALKTENDPHARQALASGIIKAQEMSGGKKSSQVTVFVSTAPELTSLPANTRVIIFARESGAQGQPVAAVALTAGELPKKVILDDSSAMIEGRLLSSISKLDIFARITLSGDAMRSDYQAVAIGVDSSEDKVVELKITP